MEVAELKGTKSLRVLNVFSTLCIGMTMLPRYLAGKTKAQDIMEMISEMSSEDKEKVIRELVEIVPLEDDEVAAVMAFCLDSNGVPYSKVNIRNLTPYQIRDGIVAVCMKVAEMKIHTISEDQKKNFVASQSTQSESLQNTQTSTLNQH